MEIDFIKKTIEDILEKLPTNTRFKGVSNPDNGEILRFEIHTEEPHFIIGTEGKTLLALNHIVKKIFEKECISKDWKRINFVVDINNYQEKRIQELKNRARIMAERARFFKSSIECPPMNPYERMIIHSFFTDVGDIKTESTGVGRQRRVVIKYTENQE